jgi:hypothetical protein
MIRLPRAFAVVAGVLTLTTISATSARAQYGRPNVSDPAIGEKYHVEAVLNLWNPSLDATISSESLGIIGSEIDVKADLGYQDKSIREFRFVLRPGRKHKFRVAYTPVSLDSDILLQKEIIFNGIRFNIGLPLQSEFKWNTWRFGYEYDFVYRDRFYAGFILEGRYMDASLNLRTPIDDEFAEARGVLPAVGGIVRGYVHERVSITGEMVGMKVPEIQDYFGSFFDLDIYGTVNITNNFGVQGGYRWLDASYEAELDTGDLEMKGFYFTGVVRF